MIGNRESPFRLIAPRRLAGAAYDELAATLLISLFILPACCISAS